MIVEIDGFYQRVFLTGRKCSKKELKQKYLQAKSMVYDIKELSDVLCRLHRFDKLTFDYDDEVDFVIDTDTDHIYTPSY
ncbi:hypothetical protein ACFCYN_23145 [Gottfriedia sp. NPDC056225]|uniref:hypothetical protein n=1 Tax=Gottfriedia sp. NPDC056225 TaxID=3345751 RepID=UPI0035D6D1C6